MSTVSVRAGNRTNAHVLGVNIGGEPAHGRTAEQDANGGQSRVYGLDTGFLVAAEVTEHAEHAGAQDKLARLLSVGDLIAIAPQGLAEFIHFVSDPRRFTQPLDMAAARQPAEQW